MKKYSITLILLGVFAATGLAQQHLRVLKVPPHKGRPSLTLMVPKDWKILSLSGTDLKMKDTSGRYASFVFLDRKDKAHQEVLLSSLDTVAEFRNRVPETTKEWKSGTSNYALLLFSSRTARAQRPLTIMSFTVWNKDYAVTGSRSVPRVVDILEAQDWELIARSIKLK